MIILTLGFSQGLAVLGGFLSVFTVSATLLHISFRLEKGPIKVIDDQV